MCMYCGDDFSHTLLMFVYISLSLSLTRSVQLQPSAIIVTLTPTTAAVDTLTSKLTRVMHRM
jgi:hypothetical protein